GYKAEEAIGKHITLVIPADRHSEETDILRRVRRGERIESYETVRQKKDGRLFDVSLTISPVFDGTGRIIGASKIARDITERRRMEAELRSLNAELEKRVADRTAELIRTIEQRERLQQHCARFQEYPDFHPRLLVFPGRRRRPCAAS